MFRSPLSRPLVVTSPFGAERPNGRHGGVDYRAPEGSLVLATEAGRIAVADFDDLNGGLVVLDSEEKLGGLKARQWAYAHLSTLAVKRGDLVQAGEPIGLSGGTPGAFGAGRTSTGPHLHLGLRVRKDNGEFPRVDPHSYISELGS